MTDTRPKIALSPGLAARVIEAVEWLATEQGADQSITAVWPEKTPEIHAQDCAYYAPFFKECLELHNKNAFFFEGTHIALIKYACAQKGVAFDQVNWKGNYDPPAFNGLHYFDLDEIGKLAAKAPTSVIHR